LTYINFSSNKAGAYERPSWPPSQLMQVNISGGRLRQTVLRIDNWVAGHALMDVISTDIAIIGAGGAGLRAAIAVAEADPSLSLCLLSKVYPMRSHTVAAEGGAAGVIKDDDNLDYHFHDTVSGGDWLCDQDAVELFVNMAPRELLQMEHWGCPW